MILLALIIGIFTTIVGAVPPGASNLAVIQSTLKDDDKTSLKISYGAGIGEVLLALLAYSTGMIIQDFFEMNVWIQYAMAAILFVSGTYLFQLKKKEHSGTQRKNSKYILGFTLGILNPPVLIYWVLVFSLLHKWMFITQNYPTLWILLFLVGVFIGKVGTLLGYSKFGLHLQKRSSSKQRDMNKVIGSILILLSIFQMAKLAFL